MLQMLLSEWIVRFFLLYLFVVGGVALIRHQQQAAARPFVFSPVSDIHARWTARKTWCVASRAQCWDKYPIRDKLGIQVGSKERSDGAFRRNGDGLRYA
jgi:hypothetical protein